jgi:hypothetical protein
MSYLCPSFLDVVGMTIEEFVSFIDINQKNIVEVPSARVTEHEVHSNHSKWKLGWAYVLGEFPHVFFGVHVFFFY